MASALYPLGKQAFLSASINMTTDTIKAALINTTSYTFSTAHQFWSSALAGLVGTAVQLTTPTVNSPNAGVFDAADTTFSAVTGSAVSAIILYKDTGTTTTSPLIAYIDGVSVTPNGGDIICTWDSGTNRIFAL